MPNSWAMCPKTAKIGNPIQNDVTQLTTTTIRVLVRHCWWKSLNEASVPITLWHRVSEKKICCPASAQTCSSNNLVKSGMRYTKTPVRKKNIRPITSNWDKKLQNYSPQLGTVIVEAFSLRKRNSRRCTTKQLKKKIFTIVSMMTKLDNDNNYGWWWWQ